VAVAVVLKPNDVSAVLRDRSGAVDGPRSGTLGDHVFARLSEAQRSEWTDFRRHVSAWERERYLEVH
jgi:glutamine synthetase